MLRVGQAVRIQLSLREFAADRDFAGLREGRSRGGATLRILLRRLVSATLNYRIVYLYGDGRCDLTWREGAGERSLRNFPVKYLRVISRDAITPQRAADDDPDPQSV